MSLQNDLTQKVIEAVKQLYQVELPTVEFQPTRKDFEGDITVVVFPMFQDLEWVKMVKWPLEVVVAVDLF